MLLEQVHSASSQAAQQIGKKLLYFQPKGRKNVKRVKTTFIKYQKYMKHFWIHLRIYVKDLDTKNDKTMLRYTINDR